MHDAVKSWIDTLAYVCAGVAVISWAQTAFVLSALAALVTVIMGGIRIYDRVIHGNWNGPPQR